MPDTFRLATLRMDCPSARHTLHCVQFAITKLDDEYVIALVSVAGPQTAVKSFAAALNENVRFKAYVDDVSVQVPGNLTSRELSSDREFIHAPGQGKYQCDLHRLPYNTVHCTARLKDETLLPLLSDQMLWQHLNGPRFTTPLLRSWTPWLRQALCKEGFLAPLMAFQCQPAMVTLNDAQLDSTVARGVAGGYLPIRNEVSACNS
jgi:hypothetical protein